MCETELTAAKALQRAQAMEAVAKESGHMRGGSLDSMPGDSDTNTIFLLSLWVQRSLSQYLQIQNCKVSYVSKDAPSSEGLQIKAENRVEQETQVTNCKQSRSASVAGQGKE